jgi:hypothetical protein
MFSRLGPAQRYIKEATLHRSIAAALPTHARISVLEQVL